MSTCPHETELQTGCPQCRPTAATLICPRCQTPVDVDVLFCGACGTATTSPFATAERVTIAHPLPPVDLATTRAVFARGGASPRPVPGAGRVASAPDPQREGRRRAPVLLAVVAAATLAVAGVTVTVLRHGGTPEGAIAPTAQSQPTGPVAPPTAPGPEPVAADQAGVEQVRRALQPIAAVTRSLDPVLTTAPRDDRMLAAVGRSALRLQQAADEVRPRLLGIDLPDGRRTALLAAVRDVHRLGVLLGRIGTAPSPQGLVAITRAERTRREAAASLDRVGSWLPGDPLGLRTSFEPFCDGLARLWAGVG